MAVLTILQRMTQYGGVEDVIDITIGKTFSMGSGVDASESFENIAVSMP